MRARVCVHLCWGGLCGSGWSRRCLGSQCRLNFFGSRVLQCHSFGALVNGAAGGEGEGLIFFVDNLAFGVWFGGDAAVCNALHQELSGLGAVEDAGGVAAEGCQGPLLTDLEHAAERGSEA